jgi:hypothetical protein
MVKFGNTLGCAVQGYVRLKLSFSSVLSACAFLTASHCSGSGWRGCKGAGIAIVHGFAYISCDGL